MAMTQEEQEADTLPAPPPYMTCLKCGDFVDETWPHLSATVFVYSEGDAEYHEYRNCPCGSTHAAIVKDGAG